MRDPLQILDAAISAAELDLTPEQLRDMRDYEQRCRARQRHRIDGSDKSMSARQVVRESTLPILIREKVH